MMQGSPPSGSAPAAAAAGGCPPLPESQTHIVATLGVALNESVLKGASHTSPNQNPPYLAARHLLIEVRGQQK